MSSAEPNTTSESSAARPELAERALAWARHVGTHGPDAHERPAEALTPADFRALSIATFREHVDALLLGRHTEEGLDALEATGALDVWLPEVAALVGFGDGEWRHKDVWKHTKQVVWQSVPRLEVRWGALLHDIGKVKTRRIEPNGDVHFLGHSEVGASMFRRRVGQRIGMEGALFDRVHFLILHHLRASQYDGSWTDSAVRRFAKEMGDGLTDLLDLSRADITTKRPERRKRGLRQISELASRIRAVRDADARVPALPKGVGTAIMSHFGLAPSRRIGELKRELEDAVERGELEGGQPEAFYVEWLEARRAHFDL